MTAEDRLRDLLRSEASTLNPTGDGLARIRERVARRRRARFWLMPSAAVATAAAAAAFVLLAPDDHKTQTLQPGGTPTPTATATTEPSATPAPAVPDDGGMPLDRAAIWPFTSPSQLAGWQSTNPYAENSLDVGRHFVADYVGLTGVDVSQTCISCGVLQLKVGGTSVGEITVLRLGVGFASGHGTQVYTVVGVAGTDLTVTSPKAGGAVVSPTSVTGRITGVDEHVDLRLLDEAGAQVAHGGAQAGSAVPWSATLSWTRSDWTHGSVVGVTRSMRDGSVTRVVAVPVSRATSAPTASFAGLVDGHVSLFDSSTGALLRQLTYPPKGTIDVAASWSAGTLAWVRTRGASVCVDELDQLQGGTASTVLKSTTAHLSSPALSPDGGLLAWVEQPCDGSAPHVVVRGGGAPDRQLAVPADATLLDLRDDGGLLVWLHDTTVNGGTLSVVPPGALTLDRAASIKPASGCETGTAAAFDGQDVVLFEVCSGSGRFVRYDDTGHRGTAGPVLANLETPQAVRVRDGKVLVWQFGGDMVGPIARYDNGTFTTLVDNNGCSSTSDLKGCISSPDW